MTRSLIILVTLAALISCHSVDEKNNANKQSLSIVVEVAPENDSSYSISWKDTVGQSAGYTLINRPTEVWCFIMDKRDTVGYYRGTSSTDDYTYFSTSDTTVTVTFLTGPNYFSERMVPGSIIEFNPININLKSSLQKSMEFVLTERRKLQRAPRLPR